MIVIFIVAIIVIFPLNIAAAQAQHERRQMSEVERELRNLESSFRSIHIPANAPPDSSPISLSLCFFLDFVPYLMLCRC